MKEKLLEKMDILKNKLVENKKEAVKVGVLASCFVSGMLIGSAIKKLSCERDFAVYMAETEKQKTMELLVLFNELRGRAM